MTNVTHKNVQWSSKWIAVCIILFCMMITAVRADRAILYGSVEEEQGILKIYSSVRDTKVLCSFDKKSWFPAIADDTYTGTYKSSWILNITSLSEKKNCTIYFYGDVSTKVVEFTCIKAPKIKLNQTTGYLTGITTKMEVQLLAGSYKSSAVDLSAVDNTVFQEAQNKGGWYVFKGKALDLTEVATESDFVFRVRVPASEKNPASKVYELNQNVNGSPKPSSHIGSEPEGANIGMSYINERITVDSVNEYEYTVVPDSASMMTTAAQWKTLAATDTSIVSIKPTTASSLYIRKRAVEGATDSDYIRPSEKIRFPLNVRPALESGELSKYILTLTTNAALEFTRDNKNWYITGGVQGETFSTGATVSFKDIVTKDEDITYYYRIPASDEERRLPSAAFKLSLAKLSGYQWFRLNGVSLLEETVQRAWGGIAKYIPSLRKGINYAQTNDYDTSQLTIVQLDAKDYLKDCAGKAINGRIIEIYGEHYNYKLTVDMEGTVLHEMMHIAMQNTLIQRGNMPKWVTEGLATLAGGKNYHVDVSSLDKFKAIVKNNFNTGNAMDAYGLGYYANMYLAFVASGGDIDNIESLTEAQFTTALRSGLEKEFYSMVIDKNSFDRTIGAVTQGKQMEYLNIADFVEKLKGDDIETLYEFCVKFEQKCDGGNGSLLAPTLSESQNLSDECDRSKDIQLKDMSYVFK